MHPSPIRPAAVRSAPMAWAAAVFIAAIQPLAAATTSAELWAEYAASPDTHALIPNCSYAGYQCGDQPIPEPAATFDLRRDFGAKGDGAADDTAAFAAAIAKAGAAGQPGRPAVIAVPGGIYYVTGLIRLDRSNVVIRGAGMDRTLIAFQKPLADAIGRSQAGGSSRWSWCGGLLWLGPSDVFAADGSFVQPASTQDWEEWQAGQPLASVSAPAQRGDRVVQVADAARLKAGDTLLMCWENPADRSLLLHMAGHPLMASYAWDKSAQGLTAAKQWRWPVEIAAVAGTAVTLRQPLRIDVRPEWKVAFTPLGAHVRGSGIEHLTLRMVPHGAGKHLADAGWNGIYLNRALHCWATDVTIENADNAVIHAAAKNTTVSGLVVTGGKHHHATALRVGSHDNLITDFRIESEPKHGINTEYLSTGNVWRRGVMLHGTFDSHRAMSFALIRTDITVNNDGTPGGGGQAGPFLGRQVVHWNIRVSGKADFIYQPECLSLGALVGIQGVARLDQEGWAMPKGDKGVVVADDGVAPAQPDLYAAQLALRQASAAVPAKPAAPRR
jgi:hypothetical protein